MLVLGEVIRQPQKFLVLKVVPVNLETFSVVSFCWFPIRRATALYTSNNIKCKISNYY